MRPNDIIDDEYYNNHLVILSISELHKNSKFGMNIYSFIHIHTNTSD